MSKRTVFSVVVVLCVSVLALGTGYALQLLSKEEALKKVFGPDAKIVTETKELADPKLSDVTKRLGGYLTYAAKGSKAEAIDAATNYDFHFALKDGQKTGVAIFDLEPGKWGPVEFIVAMDLSGVVTRVEVLSYSEKRGQPIARHSFLSQFEGKSGKDSFQVDKDITGVSGATISSNCVAFAVKKAVVLYEELYLNK